MSWLPGLTSLHSNGRPPCLILLHYEALEILRDRRQCIICGIIMPVTTSLLRKKHKKETRESNREDKNSTLLRMVLRCS